MVTRFDRITLAVPDLQVATEEYRQLIGIAPLPGQMSLDQSPAVWFILANTTLELVESGDTPAEIRSLVFTAEATSINEAKVANPLGLDIQLCDGAKTAGQRALQSEPGPDQFSVDHVVLRTINAEECIALFGEQLGIRLALDQTVPEWGGRMLFFRSGKLTLEIIASEKDRPAADYFWGLAYKCSDLEGRVKQLTSGGVEVSEVRKGRKPGTVVATVKSHCLDIPTLLIGPA